MLKAHLKGASYT